jgi:hypothetical protein
MRSLSHYRPFPALALLLFGPLAASRSAPERLQVGGAFTMTYSQMNPVPIDDAAGHVLLSSRSTGTNRSLGRDPYMEQAAVVNTEIADLAQGNGTHQGYTIFSSGADTTVNKWSGKVTTTLGSDKQPVTSFEGRWSKVRGTGRYAGVTGQGTYRGHMTGKDTYEVTWTGEIAVGRQSASH